MNAGASASPQAPGPDPGSRAQPSEQTWTIPNLLSLFRLALAPVFLGLLTERLFGAALLVLIVASVTDALDGAIARRLNQVSQLGILLDPFADRLYIFAAIVGLAVSGLLPWWALALIAARDLLIAGIVVWLWVAGVFGRRGEAGRFRRGAIPVTRIGKSATFLLLLGLPLLMLNAVVPGLGELPLGFGAVATATGTLLYWVAGFGYLRQAQRRVALARMKLGSTSTRV